SIRHADFDFVRAIDALVQSAHQGGALTVHVNLSALPATSAAGYQLYRVVQECLTNTLKHAHATDVYIDLSSDADQLTLSIKDNGQGFASDTKSDGFGLRGMKERAAHIKGQLTVQSETETETETGTTITISCPR